MHDRLNHTETLNGALQTSRSLMRWPALAIWSVIRWPEGFECPPCGRVGDPWPSSGQTTPCWNVVSAGHQVSLTAGTLSCTERGSPCQLWFWAAYMVTKGQTPGMSALQCQRQLGIKRYETALLMLHKLRAAMVRPGSRPNRY